MEELIGRDAVYGPSPDIVAREIEGELIIVPLVAGVGDMEDELYTLNETGRAIWERLDGSRTVGEIAADLARDYEAPPEVMEADVSGLLGELSKRKMVVKLK